ncbi:hypothetical protein [Azospirillum agricola]|uniref:hypothetical protein n=1 Tax=Azospirillum agricola TaxID=1720247 RepID=UPI0015C48B6E|nr:hypothetical protein [Azospirillum agricola]
MLHSPWHGLAAQRPLGSVMLARRLAHERSAAFHAEHNDCPTEEPDRAYRLPG